MRTPVLAAVLLLLAASHLAAQALPSDTLPPRFRAGLALQGTRPLGEFGDSVDLGGGVNAHLRFDVDRRGILELRADAGFVVYGSETQQVRLSSTIGERILVDLTTTNNVAFLTAGPQLSLPLGRVEPYASADAGIAYFSTTSALRDWRGESFAQTENYDDLVWTLGGGGGVYVPLSRGHTPVALDVGVRYRRSRDVSYLVEGSIRDLPGGAIEIRPIRGDADVLQLHLGVSVGLRGRQEPEPAVDVG